jgi:hypothetical protein
MLCNFSESQNKRENIFALSATVNNNNNTFIRKFANSKETITGKH